MAMRFVMWLKFRVPHLVHQNIFDSDDEKGLLAVGFVCFSWHVAAVAAHACAVLLALLVTDRWSLFFWEAKRETVRTDLTFFLAPKFAIHQMH